MAILIPQFAFLVQLDMLLQTLNLQDVRFVLLVGLLLGRVPRNVLHVAREDLLPYQVLRSVPSVNLVNLLVKCCPPSAHHVNQVDTHRQSVHLHAMLVAKGNSLLNQALFSAKIVLRVKYQTLNNQLVSCPFLVLQDNSLVHPSNVKFAPLAVIPLR